LRSRRRETAAWGIGRQADSRFGAARLCCDSPEGEPHQAFSLNGAYPFDLGSAARPAQDRHVSWDSCRSSQSSICFNTRHPRLALSFGTAVGPAAFGVSNQQYQLPTLAPEKKRKDGAPGSNSIEVSHPFDSAQGRLSTPLKYASLRMTEKWVPSVSICGPAQ